MPLEAFGALLAASDRDLVRTLATRCLFGGAYAEEVCLIAGLPKDIPAAAADPGVVQDGLLRLIAQVEGDRTPVITDTGCWPIVLAGSTAIQRFSSFSDALDAYYPRAEKPEEKPGKPRMSREEVIRKRQLQAIAGFEEKIAQHERVVVALYEHYTAVAEIIAVLDEASRKRSWQEIERILKENDHPAARMIRAVHPAEAAVELDIGAPAKIYVHESIEQNIGRYYDQIKRLKKKKAGARAAMARAIVEKPPEKREAKVRKKRWFHRFRWFYTTDNVLVLGGRDASQNEELVRRYMEGGDTFVHADVHGGSVVIVKGTTAHMDEAAQFAASYSNAWKAGHFTADVYAARPDQVSKTPEPGEYVARGGFIVRGERTYFRNTPLGIAIGIACSPEVAVIGGPPAAIAARAKVMVELAPGRFEQNDIAKKVLKQLRDRIPQSVWKEYKTVLNTEEVAAFVPPGGSDIIEKHEG
ncbi:putative rna-binding proteinous to eukaryotic snrnp [hydrocarbon metagenome]|uniref:Putative rna-binding proteinous to eukaryotic snrnp n=1 Tax=hydrocarbon metagenome TaxID=938273 RepID=A0A0W8FJ87_9ZZZZ